MELNKSGRISWCVVYIYNCFVIFSVTFTIWLHHTGTIVHGNTFILVLFNLKWWVRYQAVNQYLMSHEMTLIMPHGFIDSIPAITVRGNLIEARMSLKYWARYYGDTNDYTVKTGNQWHTSADKSWPELHLLICLVTLVDMFYEMERPTHKKIYAIFVSAIM